MVHYLSHTLTRSKQFKKFYFKSTAGHLLVEMIMPLYGIKSIIKKDTNNYEKIGLTDSHIQQSGSI